MHPSPKFIARVVCAIAALSYAPLYAQQQDYLAEVFNDLVISGIPGTEVRAKELAKRETVSITDKSGLTKDYVASKSYMLPFEIRVLGSTDPIVSAMDYVFNNVSSACEKYGGNLKRVEKIQPVSTSDITIRRVTEALFKANLYGQLECASDEEKYFALDIFPQHGGQSTLLGWKWNAYFHYISNEKFASIVGSQVKTALAVEDFREKISQGQEVSIRAKDLPSELHPVVPQLTQGFLKMSEGNYQICGLVVDTKDKLVQVQVGTNTLFLQRTKIYPFKVARQFNADESLTGDWENWCLKK